jgi:hypothetical protein
MLTCLLCAPCYILPGPAMLLALPLLAALGLPCLAVTGAIGTVCAGATVITGSLACLGGAVCIPLTAVVGTIAPCQGAALGLVPGIVAGVLPPWFPCVCIPCSCDPCWMPLATSAVGGVTGLACWGTICAAPLTLLACPLVGISGILGVMGSVAGGLTQGLGEVVGGVCSGLCSGLPQGLGEIVSGCCGTLAL